MTILFSDNPASAEVCPVAQADSLRELDFGNGTVLQTDFIEVCSYSCSFVGFVLTRNCPLLGLRFS